MAATSRAQAMPQLTKDAVVAATVQLLNHGGIGAVSTAAICHTVGCSAADFEVIFPSEREVFAELVDRLTTAHTAGLPEVTRRRSLTDLLTVTTMSFLDVLERFPDEHQALMGLQVAEISNPGLVAHQGPERSIHELLITNCRRWLDALEQIQGISWTLPTAELATMQIGATDALVLDYLTRRDRTAAQNTVRISAYQLGGYGRRQFKNSSR